VGVGHGVEVHHPPDPQYLPLCVEEVLGCNRFRPQTGLHGGIGTRGQAADGGVLREVGQSPIASAARCLSLAVNRDRAGMPASHSVNDLRSRQATLQRHLCLRHNRIGASGPMATSRGRVVTPSPSARSTAHRTVGTTPPDPGPS